MQTLQLFTVVPAVPEKISFLKTLARNLRWSWNTAAMELFRRIESEVIPCFYSRPKDRVPAQAGDGQHLFECRMECRTTGRYGFTARIMPRGDDWTQNRPGFLTWAE